MIRPKELNAPGRESSRHSMVVQARSVPAQECPAGLGKVRSLTRHPKNSGNRGRTAVVRTALVGIDLGTSNSTVACLEEGQAVVVPAADGRSFTPSVVSLSKVSFELAVGKNWQMRREQHWPRRRGSPCHMCYRLSMLRVNCCCSGRRRV